SHRLKANREPMQTRTHLLTLLFAMALPPMALGQGKVSDAQIDISQLFNGFVLSSVAANTCEKPKEPHLSQFLKNFQLVWVTAAKEIEKHFPGKSKDDIADAMKKQTEVLTERVTQVVETNGCKDEKIKQLIEGFYIYA